MIESKPPDPEPCRGFFHLRQSDTEPVAPAMKIKKTVRDTAVNLTRPSRKRS